MNTLMSLSTQRHNIAS